MAAPVSDNRGLIVLDSDPGRFLFAAWLNVSVLVWIAQVDEAAAARLKAATSNLSAEYPQGRSCVSVIKPGLPFPAEGARARFIEVLNRSGAGLANLAVVILGQGFERSAHFSYHTSVRLASTGTSEVGFLGSIEELTAWLPERHRVTGIALDPEELSRAVKQALHLASER
jgi:hypothetical protein